MEPVFFASIRSQTGMLLRQGPAHVDPCARGRRRFSLSWAVFAAACSGSTFFACSRVVLWSQGPFRQEQGARQMGLNFNHSIHVGGFGLDVNASIGGGHNRGVNFDAMLHGPGRHEGRDDACGCSDKHDKNDGVNFRRDAGADKAIDKDEFEALCKRAGITDQDTIDKAFEKLAGADGKVSKDEFKAAFGDTKVSADDFKQKFDELAKGDGCDKADESQQPDQSQDPEESSGCSKPDKPDHHGCSGSEGSSGSHSRDHWSVEQKNGEATIKL